jgi:hypothetical protein
MPEREYQRRIPPEESVISVFCLNESANPIDHQGNLLTLLSRKKSWGRLRPGRFSNRARSHAEDMRKCRSQNAAFIA